MNSLIEKFNSMEYGPAPEATNEVDAWLDAHKHAFGHYINGAWTKPAHTIPTFNPATGEKLAEVSSATAADMNAAVKAARKALPGWQALTGHQRARYLYALARQVLKHSRRLAVLESMDNGKTIRETRDIDIPLVARHLYAHAGWAQLLETEFPGYTACGVVGQIIPWNFPLLMFAWKIAPALAAGNTIVIKPAMYTPLTALAFAELAHEIGLPPGVLNVVTCDRHVGTVLVEHPDVDKIAFTGSTDAGRVIRKASAASPKKLSLELGGKSPFIVLDDADLDSAVEGLIDGIWFNQGQVCCAGSRLLVHERVAEKLYEKIRFRLENFRVGSPLDKAVDMGAIVDANQHKRIADYVAKGVEEGCTCWQPSYPMPSKGLYFPPTLLTNVHSSSTVVQEEIFGPVLVAMTFRTPAEAVELANNTVYGLASTVFSENINVALDIASQIKAGVVWVNCANMFDASCGFGGYRESGYGREGGREGMYEYLVPEWLHHAKAKSKASAKSTSKTAKSVRESHTAAASPAIDRTVKQYIGGKQARPDSGYSYPVYALDGSLAGEAPLGNRKDIRNAVEAAHAGAKWAKQSAHNRAQVLYYIAENMIQRRDELAAKLARFVGEDQAGIEVDYSIERIFAYAAWADKFEGTVHNPPGRNVTLAMNEPVGVIGILAPEESPLLGLLSLVLPAIAVGNTVVAVPSARYATVMADLYSVFDTSDLPGGVVNIVAGPPAELGKTLAEHDDVDAVWSFRDEAASTMVKLASVGNMKQTWTNDGFSVDWYDAQQAEGRYYLRHATQVKNIWVPYGE